VFIEGVSGAMWPSVCLNIDIPDLRNQTLFYFNEP